MFQTLQFFKESNVSNSSSSVFRPHLLESVRRTARKSVWEVIRFGCRSSRFKNALISRKISCKVVATRVWRVAFPRCSPRQLLHLLMVRLKLNLKLAIPVGSPDSGL